MGTADAPDDHYMPASAGRSWVVPQTPARVELPPHPLVVDAETKLCRLATQEDVRRLEAIASAYWAMVEDARERVAHADRLAARLRASGVA